MQKKVPALAASAPEMGYQAPWLAGGACLKNPPPLMGIWGLGRADGRVGCKMSWNSQTLMQVLFNRGSQKYD